MTLSTLLLLFITPIIALSSTYKTIGKNPPKQSTHSQTEPTMSLPKVMMTSHPPARGQKSLSKKKTEKERKNQQVGTHLPNEPEFLGLLYSKKASKLENDMKRSKEFATYPHFGGEEGREDTDIEEGSDDINKEVIGIPNMEDDLAEVGEKRLKKRRKMENAESQRVLKKSEHSATKKVSLTFDSKSARRAIKSFAKQIAGKIERKKSNMKVDKDTKVTGSLNVEEDLSEFKVMTAALKKGKDMNKDRLQKGLNKSEDFFPTFGSKRARRPIKSVATLIAGKVQRKIGKKSTRMVEEQEERDDLEDTPTRSSWLRKYYRRLG